MSSLRTFDPQSLDLDIYVQNVQGLGRGRGFKVIGKRSALGTPSVTQPIKGRLLDLSLMLYEEKLLSEKGLAKRFGLFTSKDYHVVEEERDALRADLSETEDQLKRVKEERDTARAELREANQGFSDKMNELIHLVSDVLEEDPEGWEVEEEDSVFAILKSGLERLIESYGPLKASIEEEEET